MLGKTRLIKETLSILSPLFITYCTYDLLRYYEIPLDQDHFLNTIAKFGKYSVLREGFIPLLNGVLGLDPYSTFTLLINKLLYSTYIAFSIISICYTLLFHVLCIQNSYEKKWRNVSTLVSKAFI